MKIDKLAIILAPNWRDYAKKYLVDCLNSLKQQDWQGEYQIFMADNESTQETVDFIRSVGPDIQLTINQHNDGFCKGNNDAIKAALAAGYEYLFLLNMDTEMEPDCLSRVVGMAEELDDWGAIQCRLMLHPETDKINSLGNSLHCLGFGLSHGDGEKFSGQILTSRQITYFSGAAVLLRKQVLDVVDLFDEAFWMYHDDLDLSLRIRLAGWPIYLAPDAVVYHKYQFAKSILQYYWMERNRFIFQLTFYRWPTLLLFLPIGLLMELGLILFAIKGGFIKEKLRVYLWLLNPLNWPYLTRRRRRIKKIRRVPDRQIVPWLSSRIEFQQIDNPLLRYIGNPILTVYWLIVKHLIFW